MVNRPESLRPGRCGAPVASRGAGNIGVVVVGGAVLVVCAKPIDLLGDRKSRIKMG